MTTKTLQQLFNISGVAADVTSVVLRDPTNTYGIRRTDTSAVVVAAGTAFTHVSTGVYEYTFTEPAPSLNYEYVIEWIYDGVTHYKTSILETNGGGFVSTGPATYIQMGIDAVACGDTTLQTFLSAHANLLWAMQVRRGVALDLQYQYFVSSLIDLALDHARMLRDIETGSNLMTDAASMDALNTSSADSSTTRTRSSSFTESSSSSQNMSRTASRSNSSSSVLNSSNSSSRNASSSDTSTIAQSSSGSSTRTQSGTSTAMGTMENPTTHLQDGTSGVANSSYSQNIISTTKHEVKAVAFVSDAPPPLTNPTVNDGTLTSSFVSVSGNIVGLINGSWMSGNSGVGHKTTPTTYGRIKPDGSLDPAGSPGNYSMKSFSESGHARSLIGSQTGSGSSSFSASGTRVNNRSGSSVIASNSSTSGNASSSMTSAAHDDTNRAAASSSHSESAFNSSMTATSTRHSEMAATDAMSASGSIDREYYSQIFDSLKIMWDDTQEIIRKLEAQMLLASQYLVGKLATTTPKANLVARASLITLPTLTQRPGALRTLSQRPYDPFIVK